MQFILYLDMCDLQVDGVFQEILIESTKFLGLTDEDCARLFDVSRPTVTRWRNGSTAPHYIIYRPLCDILKKEALKRVWYIDYKENK